MILGQGTILVPSNWAAFFMSGIFSTASLGSLLQFGSALFLKILKIVLTRLGILVRGRVGMVHFSVDCALWE